MDWYLIIKAVHIINGAVLFGTGLGIAFFFFSANRQHSAAARYFAAHMTVFADFLFTLPAVIIQPVTGMWLIFKMGYDPMAHWLIATYVIYLAAGCCWIPVVWIQLQLKKMLRVAAATDAVLPERYHRLYRLWFMLGWPAFGGLIVVYYLMVAKPA